MTPPQPSTLPRTSLQVPPLHAIAALSMRLLLALTCLGGVSFAAERPNLVFLLADDMRYDALGANGNPIVQTPALDRLAAEGVSFDRAYVTTAICMTSRASIMTGQYARTHGINRFGQELTDDQLRETYFGRLKEAGYDLGFVGKWGVGKPPDDLFDFNAGYDGQGRYYAKPGGEHLTSRLTGQAEEYLGQQSPGGKPFCLSVSFKAPHVDEGPAPEPFNADTRLASLYADATIPEPSLGSDAFFGSQPEFLRTSENRIRWEQRFATPEMYQRSVKGYYRLITGIDRAVHRLRRRLAERGLAENTVIVFASDHGFYLGERGFAGKWYAHELSIQIPLIIYDPSRAPDRRGERLEAVALNIDIAPTLVDYAGAESPTTMQGRSLRQLLEGAPPTDWRRDFYYEHDFEYATIPRSEAIRTDRFKYIVYPEHEPRYEELYDLQADPDESTNLADQASSGATLASLRSRLDALRRQAASPGQGGGEQPTRTAKAP